MPRDMEQMQLLMALSLYINSIKNNPIVLVPATPEMLFGSGVNEEEVEAYDDDDEYEYEEEEEEDEETLDENEISPPIPATSWGMGNRIVDLDDEQGESIERLPLVHPV